MLIKLTLLHKDIANKSKTISINTNYIVYMKPDSFDTTRITLIKGFGNYFVKESIDEILKMQNEQ